MNHLNDHRIYDLAEKIETAAPFTQQDLSDLDHIGQCDDCYLHLRSTMALIHVTSHAEDYIFRRSPARAPKKVRQAITAVFHLVTDRLHAVLSQLDPGSWQFDAPLAMAGSRSAQDEASAVCLLEDCADEQNFLVYDPEKKLLCIQLAQVWDSEPPRACLVHSDGSKQDIPLENRGDILWAEVSVPEDGSYQLILEK